MKVCFECGYHNHAGATKCGMNPLHKLDKPKEAL